MPWWSESTGRMVPLSRMPKPHLVAAYRKLVAGDYNPPEPMSAGEVAELEAEFREEFAVRMMHTDGTKWDENEGGE